MKYVSVKKNALEKIINDELKDLNKLNFLESSAIAIEEIGDVQIQIFLTKCDDDKNETLDSLYVSAED